MRRESSVLMEENAFHKTIDDTRAMCRAAKTPFVAMMDAAEHRSLQWGSIFTTLKPGMPDGVVIEGDFLSTLAQLLGGRGRRAQAASQWRVFPEHGISGNDVAQGELGDCWFLSAVAVLAHSRPKLIENLFIVRDVNPEGVFGVQLYVDGAWKPFLVDATFPTLYNGKLFKYARCKKNDALWVPLLEKAYAMMHGSYKAIEAGNCDEAFIDLTGMPTKRLRLTSHSSGGGQHIDLDEVFVKMISYHSSNCTMGASCGTGGNFERARGMGLRPNHCYSVLDVAVCPQTQRRLVQLRNPWGRSEFRGVSAPADRSQATGAEGVFWIEYHDFVVTFGDVIVCMTRPFIAGFSTLAYCQPSCSYAPSPDGILALHVAKPAPLHVLAIQQKIRGDNAAAVYFDVLLMLVKFGSDGSRHVVAVSEPTVERVTHLECGVADPGVYVVVPVSVNQQRLQSKHLMINVMAESQDVARLPAADVLPREGLHLGRLLFGFIVRDLAHTKQQHHGSMNVTVYTWHWSTLQMVAVRAGARMTVSVDTSQSRGTTTLPSDAGTRVTLPSGKAAILVYSTVAPNRGQYECEWRHGMQMQSEMPFFGGGAADPRLPQLFQPFTP